MSITATTTPPKVRIIPADPKKAHNTEQSLLPQRMAAYCRVSTESEEQEKSFQTQVDMYTEKIMLNPHWQMAGIYADEGLTGTIAKKRPQFMKMIEDCRKGKIDAIITKSVSRFSRNNLDCIMYVRELKELGIPIIFEKEGINTMQLSSELLIMLFSGLSQAESESISENVKMGKFRHAKMGSVAMCYKTLLGYRKGKDNKPEIDPEQAETVRLIFNSFLAGDSRNGIAQKLMLLGRKTGPGNSKWSAAAVLRILTNEKYKGDAIYQKTFNVDPISKKKQKNNGELAQCYYENHHPAIIDRAVFDRVQEELARRSSKKKVKQIGTTTEQGKYSSKYALTELLFCGDCGTPYRRCTWTIKGKKKIVWRCISRLDYGKKYCKKSPSLEEYKIHAAIADAVTAHAKSHGDANIIEHLKSHIRLYDLQSDKQTYLMQKRVNELDTAYTDLLLLSGQDQEDEQYDDTLQQILEEKRALTVKINTRKTETQEQHNILNRIENADAVFKELINRPVEYDDKAIRQLLKCVKVISVEKLMIYFLDGTEMEMIL